MKPSQISNRSLLLPYAVPYFLYVGIASLSQDRIPAEAAYILKIIVVPLALAWAWKWYAPVTGPKTKTGSVLYGIVFGIAGLVLWCALLAPFIDIKGEEWSNASFFLKLAAAAVIVPVFEEMFIRGYFLKAAFQWDMNRKNRRINMQHNSPQSSVLGDTLDRCSINDVAPGAWTFPAVLISSIAFSIGHMPYEWPAAMAYSFLISVLWIIRKDLLSCMVAHGVTNLTLGIFVYTTGNWGFW